MKKSCAGGTYEPLSGVCFRPGSHLLDLAGNRNLHATPIAYVARRTLWHPPSGGLLDDLFQYHCHAVPTIFAMPYEPGSRATLFEVARQVKLGLVGLVTSVLLLGLVLSRFIPRLNPTTAGPASAR